MIQSLRQSSFWVTVAISLVFSYFFINRIQEVVQGERTCVCAYDGYGYYMYLPQLFQYGDLKITPERAQRVMDMYCNGNFVYQLHKKKGNYLNIYHMGLSACQLPAYLVGDVFARVLNYPRDGFSTPYHLTYLLNAWIFCLLGVVYLRKLLKTIFTDDRWAALGITIVYLTTNATVTFTASLDLQHLYLFALNALLMYNLFKWNSTDSLRNWRFSYILFGLTTFIRPTQVFLFLFIVLLRNPAFWRLKELKYKELIPFIVSSLIWNLPQFLYWIILGGNLFLHNMHTEDIVLSQPHLLDFLFSFRKGWLLYTPVFILLPIGLVYMWRNQRNWFWSFTLFTFVIIYILASWECWWYAHSFGARVLTDHYALLVIPVVYGIVHARKWLKTTALVFVVGATSLNIFQSYQIMHWVLPTDGITKEYYFANFWSTYYKPELDHLKRPNLSDPNWRKQYEDKKEVFLRRYTIYMSDSPLAIEPKSFSTPVNLPLMEKLDNDESILDLKIHSLSEQALIAHVEVFSPYNTYHWFSKEMEILPNGQQQVTVQLPEIRHQSDSMKIWFDNTMDALVKINSIQIQATSLHRK